jgi:MFS family permease
MNLNKEVTPDFEFKTLIKLFFLFGFGIMSWIPRFPDIKAQLGATNGQFGSILSIGNIGGFVSLLLVGHAVHKYGTYKVLMVSTILLYLSFSLIVVVKSTLIFAFLIFTVGFAVSAFHIAVNTQAFDSQNRMTKPIIVKLHGVWTAGAVSTGLLSGILINYLSAHAQLISIFLIIFLLKIFFISQLRPKLLMPNAEDDHFSVKEMFTGMRFDGFIAGGMICAMYLEIAMGDWSNIFSREYLGIKGGLITIPYVLFMSAMIVGRLGISRILRWMPINKAANYGSVIGGAVFMAGVLISIAIRDSHPYIAFIIFSLCSFIGGLGTSFVVPSFFNAATLRSALPSAVVIGHIGLINNFLIFSGKWVVAWTAQFTSLAVALLIPGIMAISVPLFSRALVSGKSEKSGQRQR